MTAVSELDLPTFDHTDAAIEARRFHAAMAEVREQGMARAGAGSAT